MYHLQDISDIRIYYQFARTGERGPVYLDNTVDILPRTPYIVQFIGIGMELLTKQRTYFSLAPAILRRNKIGSFKQQTIDPRGQTAIKSTLYTMSANVSAVKYTPSLGLHQKCASIVSGMIHGAGRYADVSDPDWHKGPII